MIGYILSLAIACLFIVLIYFVLLKITNRRREDIKWVKKEKEEEQDGTI